jgi:hypothetical protein
MTSKYTVLDSATGNTFVVFGFYDWLVAELARLPAGATVGDVLRHHAANGDKLAASLLKDGSAENEFLNMTAADLAAE